MNLIKQIILAARGRTEQRIFSLRAECIHDTTELLDKIPHPFTYTIASLPLDDNGKPCYTPDVSVELNTTLFIEELRVILREIQDSHIMIETLRQVPLSENSLDRDRTIE